MTEIKLCIPYPSKASRKVDIVGILSRQEENIDQYSLEVAKPIILLLHGALGHKNQLYHKELAQRLLFDSFRFDFRGNGESEGSWNLGNFHKDLKDLHTVIKFLRQEYNYHVYAMIGHSRGAMIGWYYFSDIKQRRMKVVENKEEYILDDIPFWVALSGRWDLDRIHNRDSEYEPAFAKDGFFTWTIKTGKKVLTATLTREDVERFTCFPIQEKVDDFPKGTECLLVHGASDTIVPVDDVALYLNQVVAVERRPGSVQLRIIEGADHNYRGRYNHVVDVVCGWLNNRLEATTTERNCRSNIDST